MTLLARCAIAIVFLVIAAALLFPDLFPHWGFR